MKLTEVPPRQLQEVDLNKEIAKSASGQISATATVALEQLGQTYRWLLASLLSINGGGLVALLTNGDQIPMSIRGESAALFLGGMVLAIFVGLLSALTANPALRLLGEYLHYTSSVSFDGIKDEDIEGHLRRRGELMARLSFGVVSIGLLSLGLFVWAALNVVCNLSVES